MTAALSCPSPGPAQTKPDAFDVKEHYTKNEHFIPMRDGKKLFTSIYVPKDSSQSYPFLMMRTPYSVAPYGVDHYRPQLGPTEAFEKAGYIFVMQDVRGRYLSEGSFVEMRPHRQLLAGPRSFAPHETHQMRCAGGGRVVRCRGPGRAISDLSCDPKKQRGNF
jgi:hypothetical protein